MCGGEPACARQRGTSGIQELTSARARWHALNRYTPRAVSWFTITGRARSRSFRHCTVHASVLVGLGCYTVSSHSASAGRRRDVRVVEGARLESVCRGDPPTVGSNPTLSATSRFRWSVAERVGFRHCAALAAPGTNPNAGGLQALRGAAGAASGTNPRTSSPLLAFARTCLESVGFRHSAAPLAPLRARIPTRVVFRRSAALLARLRARIPGAFGRIAGSVDRVPGDDVD